MTAKDLHDRLTTIQPIDLNDYLISVPELQLLKACPQNPSHHFEGDVLVHTNMALAEAYKILQVSVEDHVSRQNIYLGTFLHDFGKPKATFLKRDPIKGDKLVAYDHETIGMTPAREFMRKYFPEIGFARREWILSLVEFHMQARNVATDSNLSGLRRFSLNVDTKEIFHVAQADSRGRMTPSGDLKLDWEEPYMKTMAQHNLFGRFYEVPDSGDLNHFEYKNLLWKVLFGGKLDTDAGVRQGVKTLLAKDPFQLVIMVGAPGSGKTTYRKAIYPDVNTICMDEERFRLTGNVSDMSKNSEVFGNCFAALVKSLNARQHTVWDATSVSRKQRQRIVDVARQKGAVIEMVYFDIPLEILLVRNQAREKVVPDNVVVDFYHRLSVPKPYEYDVLRVIGQHTPHP